MKKSKKKKGLINFLKSLDDILVLFGLLSNLGIALLSIIIFDIIQSLTKIDINILLPLITPLHILFSLGIFFLIGKSKSFKTGYIIGFLLGLIFLMKYSLGIIN